MIANEKLIEQIIIEQIRVEKRSIEFFLDWLADNEIINHNEKQDLFNKYFGDK